MTKAPPSPFLLAGEAQGEGLSGNNKKGLHSVEKDV